MKRQNIRTISLIVCTFTYLLVGAAIFDSLESETERRQLEALEGLQYILAERYHMTDDDFRVLEMVVLKSVPQKAGQSQWKFSGAFYYATTVLTTIGYGHSTPATIYGKLFTMCYAAIGIPLGLVMFQSIGERLNGLSSFAIRNIKKLAGSRNTDATETNLICVVTAMSTIIIAGGAGVFHHYERWTYFDSVYYCFITLTTIGFGDMVALQNDRALESKPEYIAFALVFILFGLAIVAALLNLLVMRFITMNTEDERRDEAEALQAAAGAVRLEGDVITANGSIISGHLPHEMTSSIGGSLTSVCSCRCPQCPLPFRIGGGASRAPRRLTLPKSPAKITHLQPFERKSVQVAVYHPQQHHTSQHDQRRRSGGGGSGGGAMIMMTSSNFGPTSSHHPLFSGGQHQQQHFMPSDSFELLPSVSPSPVLELFETSPFKSSTKRMSV